MQRSFVLVTCLATDLDQESGMAASIVVPYPVGPAAGVSYLTLSYHFKLRGGAYIVETRPL
ncbi:hypothetical protein K503DRAFT_777735, partial [Rhizopogon vinicolor AM-OR11-026]